MCLLEAKEWMQWIKNLLLVTRCAVLIDHPTAVAGLGSDFGAVYPAGATPLYATGTGSKNRLIT